MKLQRHLTLKWLEKFRVDWNSHEGRDNIIVTHELQFAKAIADRVIFLEKGQILEESDARLFFR